MSPRRQERDSRRESLLRYFDRGEGPGCTFHRLASLVLCAIAAGTAARAAESAATAAPLPQVASGRIERLAAFPSRHVATRNVDVWLPAGYPVAAPYAVLYMHDGQMLFDGSHTWNGQEWHVDETAAALIAEGSTRPFIVVGIWNAGPDRYAEYFPQEPFDALPIAVQQALAGARANAPSPLRRPGADAYLAFLVDELKPYIDAHYAVHTAPVHTAIAGSSMGGLISMYALAEAPDVFGAMAGISTHWPGGSPGSLEAVIAGGAILAYAAEELPRAGRHRLWFDHGMLTLDAAYAPWQRRVDALLRAKGYGRSDWQTRVYPGAAHDEPAWSARLDDILQFLVPPTVEPASADAAAAPG